MSLEQEFAKDRHGRRFADVVNDPRISFPAVLTFFDDPERQRRLIESELHHDRPALAGVICEFEHREDVDQFFRMNDGHVTTRFRQAVGVVVRIIMESRGWQTTGRKGSLGVRVKRPTRTTTTGTDHNTGGLALWFTRAERYVLVAGMPYRSVEERAAEIDLASEIPERE